MNITEKTVAADDIEKTNAVLAEQAVLMKVIAMAANAERTVNAQSIPDESKKAIIADLVKIIALAVSTNVEISEARMIEYLRENQLTADATEEEQSKRFDKAIAYSTQ